MNSQPNPAFARPPTQAVLNLNDLLSIRMALDNIKNPSTKIGDCIDKIDEMILTMISTFTLNKEQLQ